MGEVVELGDYRSDSRNDHCNNAAADLRFDSEDSNVPVEFAVGFTDRHKCLQKITEYGIRGLQVKSINSDPDAYLYLIGVKDAIWLNKKILEREEISDEEIAQRIDLIQMLENTDLALMDALWSALTRPMSFSEAQE